MYPGDTKNKETALVLYTPESSQEENKIAQCKLMCQFFFVFCIEFTYITWTDFCQKKMCYTKQSCRFGKSPEEGFEN